MSLEALPSPVLQSIFTTLIKYNPSNEQKDFNSDFSNPDSYFIMIRSVCKTWKNCFDELVKFNLLLQSGDNENVFGSDSRVNVKRILQKIFVVHLIDGIARECQSDLREKKVDSLYEQLYQIKEVFAKGMRDYSVGLNAVNWACESNRTGIAMILLSDPWVQPAEDGDQFIRMASENGHTQTVMILLQDERVDPAARDSEALDNVCGSGHTDTLRVLLQDGRADPNAFKFEALVRACENGHTETLRVLFQDPRMDVNQHFLLLACSHSFTQTVKFLLQDGRFDPAEPASCPLAQACLRGHIDIVRLLLQDRRANPADASNEALVSACRNGHLEIIRLLLQDGRADPAANDYSILKDACKDCSTEILSVLLQDPRVDAARGEAVVILFALAEMLETGRDLEVKSAMMQFSKLPAETRNRVYAKLHPVTQQSLQRDYPGCAEDAFHDVANLSSTLKQKSQAIRDASIELMNEVAAKR